MSEAILRKFPGQWDTLKGLCAFRRKSTTHTLLPPIQTAMGGQTNTLPITNEPHSANSISDITHPSATVITTLRLPKASGGYTLTIHSDAHHIRVAAIDSVACSGRSALVLRTLPPLSLAPPRADNTAPARAARNPAFALETASVTPRLEPDFGAFMHLLYALWTVKTDQEAVRLVVPEHVAELSVEILRRGAGIKSPFVPLSGDIHELLLLREAFWQGAMAPQFLQVEPNASFPMSYTMSVTALRHPVRAPKPMPGTVFYERWIPHLSEMISFRVVDPSSTADVTIFNRWQNVCDSLASTVFFSTQLILPIGPPRCSQLAGNGNDG
jgi:hypothetical protein